MNYAGARYTTTNTYVGNSFLHKLVISEDDGCELVHYARMDWGVEHSGIEKLSTIDFYIKLAIKNISTLFQSNDSNCGVLHFIIAHWIYTEDHDKIKTTIQTELENYNISQPAILTILREQNYYLITKEKYDEFHEKGSKIGPYTLTKSIGDDLDELCEKIAKENLVSDDTGPRGRGNYTFHLSLLTENHMKYLKYMKQSNVLRQVLCRRSVKNFHEVRQYYDTFNHEEYDVSEAEMAMSESKSKFCAALCCRFTYILRPEE